METAGFFAAGKDPQAIPDRRLYDQPVVEFRYWLSAARALGIVRG